MIATPGFSRQRRKIDLLLLAIAVLAVTGNVFAKVHEIPSKGAAEQRDVVDCPPEGNTFLPHESSCTKYYSCEEGNKYVGECPEGMIYDYIRKVCDKSHTAICINQKHNDTPLSENCYFPSDCPSVGHSRYSHERDCKLYYDCSNGRKCILSCFQGYVFNPMIGTCDLPKNVPNCNVYASLTSNA
ncbi:chitin-binding domain protein cbd-1-like [Bombus pyrosoma]|uniref:chitin-binding domain protein cbd-1-like n=1 Tax=Bombus pyrosoma TaxID=396416 RepID=UPI001CB9614D|nr:chitin-binding domain protein cbd-1-like [Bombus pyrosoma]